MTAFDRRSALQIGGAWLATGLLPTPAATPQAATPQTAAPQGAMPLPAAPPPSQLPPHWRSAPTIRVWPGAAPGAAQFRPQPLPPDWTEGYLRNIETPLLHVFRPERPNGHAVLVIPGGAYWFVSVVNEGAELAPRLTSLGYTVFVLGYRLPGEGWPSRADVPLQDAQRAMRVIRSRAGEFGVDATRVSVIGFSAGGHLAATLATGHSERLRAPGDDIDRLEARPLGVALIYPVITMLQPWTHGLSRELLLGAEATDALVQRRSPEFHVTPATPPALLVHALDDTAVPAENSQRFARALLAAGRPHELHLLQEGGHAFGVGRPGTTSAQWIALFDAWLARLAA